MTKISQYVSYAEAIKSQTAERKNIVNTPSTEALENMKYVAKNVFDKVRRHLGVPLFVSSFYRSPQLNKAIGGSPTSQHCKGEAIDIDHPKLNKKVFDYIRKNLTFDQLIGEAPDEDGNFGWVHVSLKREGNNRGEVLVAEFINGKAKYIKYEDWKHGRK